MENNLIKPPALKKGDTIALITLSWGGASVCIDRYYQGKKQLEESLGVKVIETPNALKDSSWVYENPQERYNDLMWAFKNKEIKAIVSVIGGSDCIRLLDYLTDDDLKTIRENPKIFLGLSDTTSINYYCFKAGIVSFYGPSVLFGFAENGGLHEYTLRYLKKVLFETGPIGEIKNSDEGWTVDIVPWKEEYKNHKRKMHPSRAPNFIQGDAAVKGKLIGGSLEVLEMMKGTSIWPKKEDWEDKILFIESSEMEPSPEFFMLWLRNYGAQGILGKLKGLIFGIPGGGIAFDGLDYDKKLKDYIDSFERYEEVLLKVLKEYGRCDLPVVTQLNFGHTCPMFTIPYGIEMEIDPVNKSIKMLESAVS